MRRLRYCNFDQIVIFWNICLFFYNFGSDYNYLIYSKLIIHRIMALKFTDINVKNEINSGKLVVVDLWAEWCGPCRSITPSIEELATEYEGKAIIGKYNVDEENELSTEYGVRSIPTILFFKDGKLADKQVGASPKASIKAKIDALL